MMNKIIKMMLVAILLTAAYQSQAQQDDGSKRKRMFFYPSHESPTALVALPLTVYPNPASGPVSISIPSDIKPGEEQSFILEIVNNQGVKVLQQKWLGYKIDLAKIPQGTYVVTLRREHEVYSQKLVVIK